MPRPRTNTQQHRRVKLDVPNLPGVTRGAGRPRTNSPDSTAIKVSGLEPTHIAILISLGKGNISQGVRTAIAIAASQRPPLDKLLPRLDIGQQRT